MARRSFSEAYAPATTPAASPKVPGLGDIPILGWIGRSQNDIRSTGAFYVFVRPTILRASKFEDLKEITSEKRHEVHVAGDYPETKTRFLK